MKRGAFCFLLFTCLCLLSWGCASAPQRQLVERPVESLEQHPAIDVDCDELMNLISQDCVASITIDDISPDAVAAAVAYCDCFSQLSFQVFGCTTVYVHQALSNEEWEATYADVFAECEVQHPEDGALENVSIPPVENESDPSFETSNVDQNSVDAAQDSQSVLDAIVPVH